MSALGNTPRTEIHGPQQPELHCLPPERCPAHQAREAVEKARWDFVPGAEENLVLLVAEQFRHPVDLVQSYVELLAERYLSQVDQEAARHLRIVLRACDRLARLVQALVRYHRAGELAEIHADIEPDEIVMSLFEGYRSENGTLLELRKVSALPKVSGDPELIRELFAILINNAIKFTRGQVRRVDVGYQDHGAKAIFVRDYGIGIAPEHHQRIFRLFGRLEHSGPVDGLGVGLAIARRIVLAHRGRIWVESIPGQGSTFYFTLPTEPGELGHPVYLSRPHWAEAEKHLRNSPKKSSGSSTSDLSTTPSRAGS